MIKAKCHVCKLKFVTERGCIYTVREEREIFLLDRMLDVVDCPNCGCQVYLSVRFPSTASTAPLRHIGVYRNAN